MPAFAFLLGILITAGAAALGYYLLGEDATEKQKQCVDRMVDALEPTTPSGVQSIVDQCKERFPD
tara:strand:+ start:9439 stop:9633 length:195 start_codon:yes stop_codon:yes gene_type:complete